MNVQDIKVGLRLVFIQNEQNPFFCLHLYFDGNIFKNHRDM